MSRACEEGPGVRWERMKWEQSPGIISHGPGGFDKWMEFHIRSNRNPLKKFKPEELEREILKGKVIGAYLKGDLNPFEKL